MRTRPGNKMIGPITSRLESVDRVDQAERFTRLLNSLARLNHLGASTNYTRSLGLKLIRAARDLSHKLDKGSQRHREYGDTKAPTATAHALRVATDRAALSMNEAQPQKISKYTQTTSDSGTHELPRPTNRLTKLSDLNEYRAILVRMVVGVGLPASTESQNELRNELEALKKQLAAAITRAENQLETMQDLLEQLASVGGFIVDFDQMSITLGDLTIDIDDLSAGFDSKLRQAIKVMLASVERLWISEARMIAELLERIWLIEHQLGVPLTPVPHFLEITGFD